ncbi:RING finger protein 215 [Polypterus senegalus]|uniref:RING finger protein 215 n=1 Tax=Polypterus senegalus TaxID=55291 RepID=UPI001962790D|nr:RING finger protein 215 [Polypterus senegalus]
MARVPQVAEGCCFWLPFISMMLGGFGVSAERLAVLEVFLQSEPRLGYKLQGAMMEASPGSQSEEIAGNLLLVKEDPSVSAEEGEPWIGVVPVEMEQAETQTSNQESFAASVVSKMKRALVLGASALLILALNQNTIREMDLSQVLSKPIIVIQTSENVTKLIGALLRGLRATAKITYKTILQDNLGATLTLWSSCGRSRGGQYGEWQGVICTGETNSQVQKCLQQLWNTVLWALLILCTGVIIQAHWQYRLEQLGEHSELYPKQDVINCLAALKIKKYHRPKKKCEKALRGEAENCAVCLEQFNNNQRLRVLPCLHEFHQDCVDPWLLLRQTCPLCKRSILGNFTTSTALPAS